MPLLDLYSLFHSHNRSSRVSGGEAGGQATPAAGVHAGPRRGSGLSLMVLHLALHVLSPPPHSNSLTTGEHVSEAGSHFNLHLSFMLFLECPSSLILSTVSLTHWSVLLTTLPR